MLRKGCKRCEERRKALLRKGEKLARLLKKKTHMKGKHRGFD